MNSRTKYKVLPNKRGMIATMDFIFATLIILVIMTSFSLAPKQEFPEVGHTRIMNDVIVIMEEKGYLDTLDSTIIKNEMSKIVPDNIAAEINISCYNHCSDISSPCTQNFYLNKTLNIQLVSEEPKTKSVINRFFMINDDTPLYCILNIGVWEK